MSLPSPAMRLRAASTAVLAACLGGCSLPPRDASFDSGDPAGRLDALRAAAARGDRDAAPGLIGMLDSEDPGLRMLASASLKQLTGKDFGYDATAPEPDRRQAADRWQAWWEAEGRSGGVAEPSGPGTPDRGVAEPMGMADDSP